MVEIVFNGKKYHLDKEKLIFILSKLNNSSIKEDEIEKLMKKYQLFDEYFLKQITNK